MTNKIILITSSFPFCPGEQFLETEIDYYNCVDLTIMPLVGHSKVRGIPDNVKVDKRLIEQSKSVAIKYKYLLNAFLTRKLVYQEIVLSKVFSIKKLKLLFVSISKYQRFYDIFDKCFQVQNSLNDTVVYTYWNTEATYALQSLKKKYGYKLVSRIHGGDIYKERRPESYMPLKHLFTNDIDKIFTITESANEYLSKTYGFKSDALEVSRLGVDDCLIVSHSSVNSKLVIATCSFITEVKRLDRVVDALVSLSKKNPSINFEWKHIGNGSLEDKIKQYAKEKLSNIDNVKYDFLGELDNQEVYVFYKNNAVDVFVNVSESEGVPVSIMEAMSCHIPIVAPNTGGVSDMVLNEVNGILLSEECETGEIVNALSKIDFFKSKEIRENSYRLYLEKYNAKNNYTQFVEVLKRL